MSDTITFRGAIIRRVVKNNTDTDKGVRIEVTADWTDKVREHMDWGDAPEGHGKSDLLGSLSASHLILTPADKELKRHELQIDISECTNFSQVPVKNGEGNVGHRELHFTVKTQSAGSAGKVEGYVDTVGQAAAQMKVSYVKQEDLPLEEDGKNRELVEA